MYSDDQIVAQAIKIISKRLTKLGEVLNSPHLVRDFLRLRLSTEEREVFGVIWLSAQNRLIKYEEMFFGTITEAAVYPREVAKAALKHNAVSAIFFHNHPSGEAHPSAADERLTARLKDVLEMIEVKVLDHIIVGGMDTMSFAEAGLI